MFSNRNAATSTRGTTSPDESHQAEADSNWKNVSDAADVAGVAAEQVQLLLGRAAQLHAVQRRRHADDGARGARQQPVAAARAAGDLDVAGDEPAAVRGGIRHEPDPRLRAEAQPRQQQRDDSGHRAVHGRLREQRRHRAGNPRTTAPTAGTSPTAASSTGAPRRPTSPAGTARRSATRRSSSTTSFPTRAERRLAELPRQQRHSEPAHDDRGSGAKCTRTSRPDRSTCRISGRSSG